MPEPRFVVLRSMGAEDATVRLQSDPILAGLRAAGRAAELHATAAPGQTAGATWLLFHFADARAAELIRTRYRPGNPALRVACLGSDIYDYRRYFAVHDIADLFLMPSDHHRRVLASQVYRPVHTLPECTDPIAGLPGSGPGPDWFAPRDRARRLLWFGYAESFGKGMHSLLPVIRAALAAGTIDSFSLIVDVDRFEARYGTDHGFTLIPYGNDTFHGEAARFDYAVLSHFARDLHVNSLIKSPNKAVTALAASLVPLASATPNYRDVLEGCGLSRLLFESPAAFASLLRRLDPAGDAALVRDSGAAALLRGPAAPGAVAPALLAILDGFGRDDATLPFTPEPDPLPQTGFGAHLRDLLPSALRALRSRRR